MKIAEVDSFEFEERGQAPGQAINVKSSEGTEVKYTRETEFYQLPGFASGPTKKDQVILLPIEGGYEVIVASHNYRIGVSVTAGQVKVFSTNVSGSTKQAEIFLDTDGKITIDSVGNQDIKLKTSAKVIVESAEAVEFMGNDDSLVKWPQLDTALQTLVGAINTALGTKLDGGGSPGSLTLDISSAEADKLKTG